MKAPKVPTKVLIDDWTEITKASSDEEKSVKTSPMELMNQEVSANMERLNQDLQIINKATNSTVQGGDLDLMFIMDCTGSMGSWI